jgi:hypothetical protein
MIVSVLLIGAVACLAIAFALLRSLGVRYRVGRLLAVAPLVAIEQASELATRNPKYIRMTGRISSDEEFPDENDRPLVFRRKRIEIGDGAGKWRTIADEREAVPFGIETRDAFIAVDTAAIGDGLIAIPRESTGVLSDLPADLLDGVTELPAPNTPARLVIEQLSAVEHATVCGVPELRDGQPVITFGLGRPLIVTTLEPPAAMRLLAAGQRPRVLTAAAFLAGSVGFAVLAAVAAIAGH